MEDCPTVVTAQSASVYVSMQPLSWVDHETLRRGAALNTTHKHTRTHTVDQAQANYFLWLGNKQCTCHTHHTSNKCTHTHTHLDSVCVQGEACMCFFQCKHRAISPDRLELGVFLARPAGLRHLQIVENTMKTGSQFLDGRKKTKGEMACGVLQPQ